MPIFSGSRYRFDEAFQVLTPEGTSLCHVLRKTTVEPPQGSRRYTTKAGDTFETLAFERYGNANKWYVIADANPQVFWMFDLIAGQEIIIPPKSYAELS
jgi:nucleoid-associated protein YgaU